MAIIHTLILPLPILCESVYLKAMSRLVDSEQTELPVVGTHL